ncbi:MAG: putative short-chain dehydrogenase [Frankiales bacterium]|nr:putative short-chain dehydrogenase [Frankiales bacterium]
MTGERVALVTGGTSGIGQGVARGLVEEGWRVVVTSRRSGEGAPGGTRYVAADVSDRDAVAHLIDVIREDVGRLDLVVNNAGVGPQIPHADLDAATPELWQEILGVNLLGPWHVVVSARRLLEQSGRGHVVNIASIAAVSARGSSIPYSVSKAGLAHLTRLLARSLAPTIRVNAIAPGWIDSPRNAAWPGRDTTLEQIPLRVHGRPADVADAVLGLDRMGYVTGELICVDGGLHLG